MLFIIRSGEKNVVKQTQNRKIKKLDLLLRFLLSPTVLGYLFVVASGALEDVNEKAGLQILEGLPKNPDLFARLTWVMTVLRWVFWGQPIVGLSYKFKGTVVDYTTAWKLE